MSEGRSQEEKQFHIVVDGRVQGVGFRYFVYEAAQRHEIVGWVRNRPDRTVEIRARGSSAALDAFVHELRQGPPASRVDNLDLAEEPPDSTFSAFTVNVF